MVERPPYFSAISCITVVSSYYIRIYIYLVYFTILDTNKFPSSRAQMSKKRKKSCDNYIILQQIRSDSSYLIIFTLLLHRYLHRASPVASSSKHKHSSFRSSLPSNRYHNNKVYLSSFDTLFEAATRGFDRCEIHPRRCTKNPRVRSIKYSKYSRSGIVGSIERATRIEQPTPRSFRERDRDFSSPISSRRKGNTLARREHVTNRSHRGPRRDSIRWFPSPNSGWRAGGPDAAIIPRNDCHYREREGERAGGRTGQRDWPALRLRFCLVPLADKLRLRTSLLCSGRLRPQPASRCNFVASCYSISPLKTAFWNRSVPCFKTPILIRFHPFQR